MDLLRLAFLKKIKIKMKQYDKNSLIGFALMAIILIVFNTFFFPEIPKEETTNNTSAIEEKKSLLLGRLRTNEYRKEIMQKYHLYLIIAGVL